MIRPLGKNILIKVVPKEKKGVVIVPDNQGEPYHAQVIDVGAKVDLEIAVNDMLLMVPFSGSKISLQDDGYLLVTERDILGVLVYE